MPTALVVGGTGPTGPYVVHGLRERGYTTTILHTGKHEIDEIPGDVEHLHTSPYDPEAFLATIGERTFDVTIVMYGRLRAIATIMRGRTGQFISVGGVPALRGFMDATLWSPPGMPIPTRNNSLLSGEESDGKSYRVARTEELLFEAQPAAAHFRYPMVYGPRQPAPREWSIVRRVLDRRDFIILPDGGLTLLSQGYVENLAHALLLAVDQPEAAAGQRFNAADDDCLSLRQIVEIVSATLGHSIDIVNVPYELAEATRPLVQQPINTHRLFDTSNLRERLGYRDVIPARDAIGQNAQWLAAHPPTPGGIEEQILEDPFDYESEDAFVIAWKRAVATLPSLRWRRTPGFGLAYSGPDATWERPSTRI